MKIDLDRRPLLKPGEVAEYLRVTETRLRQWRYLGQGPKYCKVGAHVRYSWTDIQAWLEQGGTAV